MSFHTGDWDELFAPYKQALHEEIKKMYRRNRMMIMPSDEYVFIQSAAPPDGGKTLLFKPHLPGVTPPPGTNVLPAGKVRVGDTVKDEYLDRLREGFAGGCITEGEFDARQAAIMAAVMEDDLKVLVRDLPARPQEKEVSLPRPAPAVSALRWLASLTAVLLPLFGLIGMYTWGDRGAIAALMAAGGLAALCLVASSKEMRGK